MIFVAFVLVLVIACRVLAPYKAAAAISMAAMPTLPSKAGRNLHSSKGPCCPTLTGPVVRCRLGIQRRSLSRPHRRPVVDVPDEAVIKERTGLPGPWCGRSIIAGSARPCSGYPLLHAGQHD